MNKLLLLFAILLMAFGCQSDPTKPVASPIHEGFDLKAELYRLQKQHKVMRPLEIQDVTYPPDPLPEVSYTIGKVHGTRVPVYMHSQGRRSQGGLLFLEYDDRRIQFVNIEPGPAWGSASFTHATINDQVPGHAIFILIGWELDEEGHAIGAAESDEPWAYLLFEPVRPGKSKIVWDPLPRVLDCSELGEDVYCFFRRGEMLVDLAPEGGDPIWDVVDYYTRNGVNTTGTVTVEPGYAIVAPR